MSEMRDDTRRMVSRFSYLLFAFIWAFVAYKNGPDVVGWLFAAFSARCLWRLKKIWNDDDECDKVR